MMCSTVRCKFSTIEVSTDHDLEISRNFAPQSTVIAVVKCRDRWLPIFTFESDLDVICALARLLIKSMNNVLQLSELPLFMLSDKITRVWKYALIQCKALSKRKKPAAILVARWINFACGTSENDIYSSQERGLIKLYNQAIRNAIFMLREIKFKRFFGLPWV